MGTITLNDVTTGVDAVAADINDNNTILEGAINGGLDETNFASGKVYSPDKIKQDGATTGQALVWDGTDWAPATPAENPVLAIVVYKPGSDTAVNAPETFADVDATNAKVTFTAPASGAVLIEVSALAKASAASSLSGYYWNLRDGTTDISGSDQLILEAPSTGTNARARVTTFFLRSGLSPGSGYTYKLGHKVSTNGVAQIRYGTVAGPLVIRVSAA